MLWHTEDSQAASYLSPLAYAFLYKALPMLELLQKLNLKETLL